MKQNSIDEAASLWKSGKPLIAGRILYERISSEQRPLWASAILDVCRTLTAPVPEIDSVCEIAQVSSRWKEAHDAFNAVRMLTLLAEQGRHADQIYKNVLVVAENAAKVVYNASGGSAPFDHNAGWQLVASVRHVVDLINSSDFEAKVWKIMTS